MRLWYTVLCTRLAFCSVDGYYVCHYRLLNFLFLGVVYSSPCGIKLVSAFTVQVKVIRAQKIQNSLL